MSNLFKSGFQGIKNVSGEPYIIDANKRKLNNNEPQNKIIRPVTEPVVTSEAEEIAKKIADEGMLNDAMDMAKELREDAIARANKIVEDARKEAEEIHNSAYKMGYEKGLEEGSMEAMRRADEYLDNLQKEQEVNASKNQEIFEQNIQDAQDKLVDLSCALIEKLTGVVVEQYKPVMLYIINNALNDIDTGNNFTIKVSESNYTYIMDNYDRLAKAGNPNITLEVYGDAKLDKRQCIIETEHGIIDISMDVQVKNLITAMKMLA